MGHSSKFTFPLPGRKQKPAPPPAAPPATSSSKAQRFLGPDAALNRTPHDARPPSLVSGISISISESTDGPPDDDLQLQRSAPSPRFDATRRPAWDEDSGVLPARSLAEAYTDASSLRRRQSTSTLFSYYDKSKLPLSISQQTSNSAMAKGLPSKAKELLDMDGAAPMVAPPKRSPRLDLAALVSKTKNKAFGHSDSQSQKSPVQDLYSVPSPVSPAPPSPNPQRPDRLERLQKKTSRGLRGFLPTVAENYSPRVETRPERPPPPIVDKKRPGPSKTSVDLSHLYEHYEQRMMHDLAMQGIAEESMIEPRTHATSPFTQDDVAASSPTSLSGGLLPPTSHAQRIRDSRWSPSSSFSSPPTGTPIMDPAALLPIPGQRFAGAMASPDYAASISSRHTRTSRASKKTDRSLGDLDLQLNSVLSLSSDSEDDYFTGSRPPQSSASFSTESSAPHHTESVATDRTNITRPPTHDSAKQRPGNTQSPIQHAIPPKISKRISSIKTVSSSEGSARSGYPETQLAPTRYRPPSVLPPVSNVPSHGSSDYISEAARSFPVPGEGSQTSSSTPATSTHAPRSLPTDPRALRTRPSATSLKATEREDGNDEESGGGRFIVVTKQEEMLLAALRQKRAQLRGASTESSPEQADSASLRAKAEAERAAYSVSRRSSRSTIRGTDTATLTHKHSARNMSQASLQSIQEWRTKGVQGAAQPAEVVSEEKSTPLVPRSRFGRHKAGNKSYGSRDLLFTILPTSYVTEAQSDDIDVSIWPSPSTRGAESRHEQARPSAAQPSDNYGSAQAYQIEDAAAVQKRRGARLSAVGHTSVPEAGWWDDDG